MKIKIQLSIIIAFIVFSLSSNKIWGNQISNVSFSFCNDTSKNKIINIQAGGIQQLCINFYSKSSEKIQIQYGFSKGFIKNLNGLQLCDQDMGPDNDFSKLFSNNSGNKRTIIIPPQGFTTIYETIKAPIGINGMIYGCLTFKANKIENTNAGGMFNVIERKTVNFKLLIGKASDVKSSIKVLPIKSKLYSSNKNIQIDIKNNKISVSFKLKNDGNITQEAKIEGNIHNILGFQKTFQTDNYIIAPGTTLEIKKEIGLIPTYKGIFKISFKINSLPYVDFQLDNVDQSLKKPIIIQGTGDIFIYSWIWIVLAIIILSIVIITFKPIFKKH